MTFIYMTDLNNWPKSMVLFLIVGVALVFFCWLAFRLYITKRYWSDISSSFSNSPLINSTISALQAQGLFARSFAIDFISGTLSCSKVLIRKQRVSHDDIKSFPSHLRSLFSKESLIFRVFILWSIVLYLLLEFRGHSS